MRYNRGVRSRKYRVVTALERGSNRLTRWALRAGLAPQAFALLETTGRQTGLARHTPVGSGALLLGRVAEPNQVELYPVAVDDHDDARAFGAGGHQVVIQGGQQHVIALF